jgi:hypothetical protein
MNRDPKDWDWDRIPIPSRRVIDEEHEREFFSDLAAKCVAGARGDNVSLSPNEYEALLKVLRQRRQSADKWEIAEYCGWLEVQGLKTEAAVQATMDRYNVSRSTVFSVREKYLESKS